MRTPVPGALPRQTTETAARTAAADLAALAAAGPVVRAVPGGRAVPT